MKKKLTKNKEYFNKLMIENIPENIKLNFEKHIFDIFSTFTILNNKNLNPNFESIAEDDLTNGSGDMGIDSLCIYINGFHINSIDELETYAQKHPNQWNIKIFIVQAKFKENWEVSVWEKYVSKLSDFLKGTLKPQKDILKYKQSIILKILDIMSPRDSKIELFVNYCTIANTETIENNKEFVDTKNKLYTELKNLTFLDEIIIKEVGSSFIKENINIKDLKKTLKFIEIHHDSFYEDINNGFIGLASIENYFNFIKNDDKTIDDELFESNVRDLEDKSNVNKSIVETLEKDNDIDFWWLNNGITMIAETATLVNKKITLTNPQIINGLQTSYSIFNWFSNEKIQNNFRKILIKIIILNDYKKSEKIIKASNTQNPMNYATLAANNPILKDLEEIFKENNIFFERRKRYYKNRFFDKDKIIEPDYVAKYFVSSFWKDPSTAKNRTIIYFRDNDNFDKIFNENNKDNLIDITIMSMEIIRKINNLNIEDTTLFKSNKIKEIKVHFKYHIISLFYEKYKIKQKIDDNNLKIIINKFISILEEFIKNNAEESIRKISTSKNFQQYMYENFK